jgi:hypothetical protein
MDFKETGRQNVVKVKSSLYLTKYRAIKTYPCLIKHRAMKTYGKVEV